MERTTIAAVERATKDLESVLFCQHDLSGKSTTLRFIKSRHTARRSKEIRKISSTRVREAMRVKDGHRLKSKLEDMALSAEVLWHQKSVWVDGAKQGLSSRINFPTTCDEDVGPGADDKASIDCYAGSSP